MPARPSKCKLCGSEHWNSEPHAFQHDKPVTKPVTREKPVTKPVTPAPEPEKPVTLRKRGPQRIYPSNAERQRAYRERKRQADGR